MPESHGVVGRMRSAAESLPFTGTPAALLGAGAILLVLVGGAALLVGRRGGPS